MKRGLFNIESNTITPLVEQGIDAGSISSVRMTNTSTASVVVELTMKEGANVSHLVHTTIPAKTTLLVNEGLAFNNSIFELNLKTTSGSQLGASTPLSVIIR
jgi:hypothetical protein